MTITITQGGQIRFGENDVRTFVSGEEHDLAPQHERKLIDSGMAREGGVEDDQPASPRRSKAMNPVKENKAIDPVAETKSEDPVIEVKRKPKKA